MKTRRELRAPTQSATALVEPNGKELLRLVSANAIYLAETSATIGNIPLADLRQLARSDFAEQARQFTSHYRDIPPNGSSGPLVVTGHQPALYHPGVWFKNFLAHQLAKEVAGTAINVIIDNDVAGSPSITGLSGNADSPRPSRIAYDHPGARLPWEMTRIQSEQTFRQFPAAVRRQMGDLVEANLIDKLWPAVLAAYESGKPLGLAFSQGRNCLEADAGLNVLDLPLSLVCQRPWFLECIASILRDAESFREVYNRCVVAYRQRHRLRSTSHPVPLLEQDGTNIEVPYWVWTETNPQRRPLWVNRRGQTLNLNDQQGLSVSLDDASLIDGLRQLRDRGIFVRTRALTTTMFLRLVASDLFIHGIGGSKYDEVTDEIIRQYLQVEPPKYATATATVRLPIELSGWAKDDLLSVNHSLRDGQFNPDRIAATLHNATPRQIELLRQKDELLANIPPLLDKPQWHARIMEVNRKLRDTIAPQLDHLLKRKHEIERCLAADRLRSSREYSTTLFSYETLSNLLLDLARNAF